MDSQLSQGAHSKWTVSDDIFAQMTADLPERFKTLVQTTLDTQIGLDFYAIEKVPIRTNAPPSALQAVAHPEKSGVQGETSDPVIDAAPVIGVTAPVMQVRVTAPVVLVTPPSDDTEVIDVSESEVYRSKPVDAKTGHHFGFADNVYASSKNDSDRWVHRFSLVFHSLIFISRIFKASCPPEFLGRHLNGVEMRRSDRNRLNDGQWLNNNIVDWATW